MHPRLLTTALAVAALTAIAPPALATGAEAAPTGRLLVTVSGADAGASERVREVVRDAGSRAEPADVLGTTAAVPVPGGSARARLAARLARDGRVVQVVDERPAVPRASPDDPVLTDQEPLAPAGTSLAWWAGRLRLPQAWRVADGAETTVAVIDTGFDLTHPQLEGIVDRALTSRISGASGTARTDEEGHGTHVASLACSAFDDGAGTVGAGGRCRLVTIKSDLYPLSVARAVRRAAALGVDAIVMSFGSDSGEPATPALREALEDAARDGVVLVAAAADDGSPEEQGWPANVLQPTGTGPKRGAGIGLTVTAATAADARASYAGLGTQVSVAAYGSYAEAGGPPGILGAFPATSPALEAEGRATRATVRDDRRYAYEAGTSYAAPMVAGVAVLVRSANPELDAADVRDVLKRTARRKAGWTPGLGWGIVDARAAVDAGRRLDRRAPVATFSTTPARATGPSVRLRWRGSDRSPAPQIPSGLRTVELWRSVDGGRFSRVGQARRGLVADVPRGTVRFALRAVDKAGNRAKLRTTSALVVTRR